MLNIFGKKQGGGDGFEGPGAFGPYQLEELINTGGMAHLWLGTNPEGQTVHAPSPCRFKT